jgi:hypothetical protein
MFRVLFARIVRSTLQRTARGFVRFGVFIQLEQVVVLGPIKVLCSCAPDDGCKQHPKHVELRCQEKNKEHSTSSWT